jgi:hypothetical protein
MQSFDLAADAINVVALLAHDVQRTPSSHPGWLTAPGSGAMTPGGCKFGVPSAQGHEFLLTGKAYVNGHWTFRRDCADLISARGGTTAPDSRRTVTLFVFGDLSGKVVVDPKNSLSQKALFVIEQREEGNHIHVVDADGFSSLLDGGSAVCLDLYRDRHLIGVRSRDAALAPAWIGTQLSVDLTRTTPKLIAIRNQLVTAMRNIDTTVFERGARMPLFDATWRSKNGQIMYVARIVDLNLPDPTGAVVRSLGRCDSDRKAIGKFGISEHQIGPVLIIDRAPTAEWRARADKMKVHLTWPERFPRG